MADLTQRQAYNLYDKVRQKFKNGEQIAGALSENFEGCEWVMTNDGDWARENNNGKRMVVMPSRHAGFKVLVQFKHAGSWYSSERHYVDG